MITTESPVTPPRLSARFASCGKDETEELLFRSRRSLTRKDAVSLGLQHDVSRFARRADFKTPVFITDTVYKLCNARREGFDTETPSYRLWRILWALRAEVAWGGLSEDGVRFEVCFQKDDQTMAQIPFVGVCTSLDHDDDRPAITIMLPYEGQE